MIFTNRAGEEIPQIQPSDNYEDWPKEANITGVELQEAQDHHETTDPIIQVEADDDTTSTAPEIHPEL
eukprot:11033743-Ditylum_brightwellii.AAC.1